MRKVFFIKLVNMAKQLLSNTQTTLHYLRITNSKGVKTALKHLFPLWNNCKKKVNLLAISSFYNIKTALIYLNTINTS